MTNTKIMFKTEIKNGEVYIEGVPSSKWTSSDWAKWKGNTTILLQQCERMMGKLMIIGENWGKGR